jgi:hypothetical protein
VTIRLRAKEIIASMSVRPAWRFMFLIREFEIGRLCFCLFILIP